MILCGSKSGWHFSGVQPSVAHLFCFFAKNLPKVYNISDFCIPFSYAKPKKREKGSKNDEVERLKRSNRYSVAVRVGCRHPDVLPHFCYRFSAHHCAGYRNRPVFEKKLEKFSNFLKCFLCFFPLWLRKHQKTRKQKGDNRYETQNRNHSAVRAGVGCGYRVGTAPSQACPLTQQ